MAETINKLIEMIFITMEQNEWSEELLYDLSTELTNDFEGICSRKPSREFWDLYDYTDSYWRNQDNQDKPEHAFFVGRLYGMLDLIKRKCDALEKEELLVKYDTKGSKLYDVLKNIYQYPGIIHDELTRHVEGGKSALSQFVKEPEADGLIRSVKSGKQKHYYLTPLGTKVYQRIKPAYEERENVLREMLLTDEDYVPINALTNAIKKNAEKCNNGEYVLCDTQEGDRIKAKGVSLPPFLKKNNNQGKNWNVKSEKRKITNDAKKFERDRKSVVGF
ncbi:MAG: hypothetical protein NC300_02045 [Bacteroidales bacterium]|nr:hypothetical protein [Clostridium sp.]MCM1202906.1 hypothetical protein [Bacteroidales bacterium]